MSTLKDLSYLAEAKDIWNEWRFEPWKNGSAEGLKRRVSLIKSGLIGEIARYYVDDYIIWKYNLEDPKRIFSTAESETDLMSQRFLFVKIDGKYYMRKKSFLMGLRGFIEIHMYRLGIDPPKAIEDLAFLVNKAEEVVNPKRP
ncbi:MAG: hypothetical protein PHO18_06690 [Synergistaceae bacterium]|nr:hypothetical protein [Synergistaceae bacterium]